jgi:hypothetical protein
MENGALRGKTAKRQGSARHASQGHSVSDAKRVKKRQPWRGLPGRKKVQSNTHFEARPPNGRAQSFLQALFFSPRAAARNHSVVEKKSADVLER